MQKYKKLLAVLRSIKLCHFDNLIGGKLLFRCSRKCAQEINEKFGAFCRQRTGCKELM